MGSRKEHNDVQSVGRERHLWQFMHEGSRIQLKFIWEGGHALLFKDQSKQVHGLLVTKGKTLCLSIREKLRQRKIPLFAHTKHNRTVCVCEKERGGGLICTQ